MGGLRAAESLTVNVLDVPVSVPWVATSARPAPTAATVESVTVPVHTPAVKTSVVPALVHDEVQLTVPCGTMPRFAVPVKPVAGLPNASSARRRTPNATFSERGLATGSH